MLGQPISMVLPQVVGYKLTGKLPPFATSTDLVLTITKVGVVRNNVCVLHIINNSRIFANWALLANL